MLLATEARLLWISSPLLFVKPRISSWWFLYNLFLWLLKINCYWLWHYSGDLIYSGLNFIILSLSLTSQTSVKYNLRKMFRVKVNFATPIVRFIHHCQVLFHSNAGSVLRLLLLKSWCPPPLEMAKKPPSLIILDSRARLAGPWLWVCALDTLQVKPNPLGAPPLSTAKYSWKRVRGWGLGRSAVTSVRTQGSWYRDEACRQGGSTGRYFQEKLGEEEPTIPDASKVEDTLRRHYF